jgi:hypothetical protein
VISLVLNLLIWFWLFWQISGSEEVVLLHYNILFGVDYIGPRYLVAMIPLTGLFILISNAVVGWLSYPKDKMIAAMLNFATSIIQIFLLVAASLVVFLNV